MRDPTQGVMGKRFWRTLPGNLEARNQEAVSSPHAQGCLDSLVFRDICCSPGEGLSFLQEGVGGCECAQALGVAMRPFAAGLLNLSR